jgi:formamidopyrimidine-DNA glycosylase
MPEGPEIWMLSKTINKFYSNDNTLSYGKHLIVKDIKENWSFGLNGKVGISPFNELVKINGGWINGDNIKYIEYQDSIKELGLDWMTASKEELEKEIDKWIKSKKKLAGLILDQSKICGIGVAWGSEILFKADLRPDVRACDQVLNKLVDSMGEIRKKIQETYELELERTLEVCKIYNNNNKLRLLIDDWFENLYEIREMVIYKKGSKLQVLGRSWWV